MVARLARVVHICFGRPQVQHQFLCPLAHLDNLPAEAERSILPPERLVQVKRAARSGIFRDPEKEEEPKLKCHPEHGIVRPG